GVAAGCPTARLRAAPVGELGARAGQTEPGPGRGRDRPSLRVEQAPGQERRGIEPEHERPGIRRQPYRDQTCVTRGLRDDGERAFGEVLEDELARWTGAHACVLPLRLVADADGDLAG